MYIMKASGIEDISHKGVVFSRIATHYNNPDTSDVTLIVAEQSYYVHRFVLAAQSSVFQSMLTGDKWKESNEKVIQLEESPASVIAFGDFLKFFYTGTLTLNCDNVCGIHMLADKYDVQLLKRDAENFMKEVMTGVHGVPLPSSLKWLGHIEKFIPNLLSSCYEAIQINFSDLVDDSHLYLEKLECRHLEEILTSTSSAKEVAVRGEKDVYDFVAEWAESKFSNLSSRKAKMELNIILPLIRFHNMKVEELEEVEESKFCKAMGNSFILNYISPAYKVHSQMTSLAVSACKKRRLSKGFDGDPVEETCSCESAAACPHLNPRFYFNSAGGVCDSEMLHDDCLLVEPLDLGDLKTYAKLFTGVEENDKKPWTIEWSYDYDSDLSTIKETFTVKPAATDIGRYFTIVISLVAAEADEEAPEKKYAIKHTEIVRQKQRQFNRSVRKAESIVLDSPRRRFGSWEIPEDGEVWLGVAIHLHKQLM